MRVDKASFFDVTPTKHWTIRNFIAYTKPINEAEFRIANYEWLKCLNDIIDSENADKTTGAGCNGTPASRVKRARFLRSNWKNKAMCSGIPLFKSAVPLRSPVSRCR